MRVRIREDGVIEIEQVLVFMQVRYMRDHALVSFADKDGNSLEDKYPSVVIDADTVGNFRFAEPSAGKSGQT